MADPTSSSTATIRLAPVTIAMTPTTVTLNAGQLLPYTALVRSSSNTSVTWSISPNTGSISSGGLYTAPGSNASAQSVTVTGTSVADATSSSTATIRLAPVTIAMTPTTVTLNAGQTQQFTATVGG